MKRRLARRRGRPPKDPARQRLLQVKVYMTETEKKRLAARAAQAGLSMSDFCRSALKGAANPSSVPPLHRDALRQLAGIGNNLNQLTRHLHGGGELYEVHEEFIGLTDTFRSLLHAWKDPTH